MKNIRNTPFLTEMADTVTNTYRLGWDERNGGNISYLLEESLIAPYLEESGSAMELPEKLAVTVKHKRILFLRQPAKKRA